MRRFADIDATRRYYRRYTEGFGKGCWAQADLIVRDMNTGALNLLGRSDNVLNPSGVRFGR